MNRRAALAVGTVVIAIGFSAIATAATTAGSGSATSQSNRQYGTWRSAGVSTTYSTNLRQLTGLGARICSRGEVSATLSVDGAGAPMQLQVRVDGGEAAAPGQVVFSPFGTRGTIASFTFLTSTQPFEANDHHVFEVDWRSATGQRTILYSATLNLLYQQGTKAC